MDVKLGFTLCLSGRQIDVGPIDNVLLCLLLLALREDFCPEMVQKLSCLVGRCPRRSPYDDPCRMVSLCWMLSRSAGPLPFRDDGP